MTWKKVTEHKGDFTAILIIGLFYGGLFLSGITCPIKFMTGISCLGCGMTRAWLSAFCLHFSDAFYYHPLFWTIPLLLVTLLCKSWGKKRRWIIFGAILLFVSVYFYRIAYGDGEVVAFDPSNGFIFRMFDRFIF